MFPDAQYYVTVMNGNSHMAIIVRGMDMFEFFLDYQRRFSRYPYIMSLIPLDHEEFEEFLEYFEEHGNEDTIFDNGELE